MPETPKPLSIAIIVGSLRAASFNRRLAEGLIRLPVANGTAFTFPEIGDLPLYNQDDDDDPPASARRLKAEIRATDGVIFATPEYNRSIPGVLKNAIDHASRPYGDSAWRGKPSAIIGTSPGPAGTAMAQQHLRNVLAVLDVPTLGLPEAYVHYTPNLFDADGAIAGHARERLERWLEIFLTFVDLHRAPG